MTDIQYVQLDSSDFLTDIDFQMMDAEQRGVYCSIILYLYCNEGRIELNGGEGITLLDSRTSKLAQMSGCLKTGAAWETLWNRIAHKFQITGDILTHKRVSEELKRSEDFIKAKSDAGKKGMASRWGDNTVITKVSKVKVNYSQNSNEFRLSSLLIERIIKRKPDFKKPNLQSWAGHIDKMIRLDNRKPARIREIIQWCQSDDFWQNNILSTAKLRKQFDKLELKEQSERKTTTQDQLGGSPAAGRKQQAPRKNRNYSNQETDCGVSIDNAD